MKILIIKIGVLCLNLIYVFIKLFKTKNKVVMISRQADEPSFEFEMLKDELNKIDSTIEVVFLCKTLDGGVNAKLKSMIRYSMHMFVQMYHIATSKVVVLDSYCITASVLKHKRDLKIIQMWHSMGTMKMFGYQILNRAEGSDYKVARAMKMHKNYDYVLASGEGYAQYLADGFDCDVKIVKIMPLPRMDLLLSEKFQQDTKASICDKYEVLKAKKNVLYCPTFRKDESGLMKATQDLIEKFDFDNFNLIIKLHPLSKLKISDERVIFANEFNTFEMLSVSDYIISDYSCVVYEAGILNKPIYFYDFDISLYEDNRGFTLDYLKEMPGVVSPNVEDILKAIKDDEYDYAYLSKFINKYVNITDHASLNIANFIRELVYGKAK